ncbi:hypothetical protein ElyMa_002791200 [Elysia marginata]|uniref:Rieske domain-containing protein n=1 Tax=Elysia marginata TaxID=1093978 RepID=A0AAV4HPT7_9GAST|nr:hypothetical protein ElyMa_002791200 [Elysia marginata]
MANASVVENPSFRSKDKNARAHAQSPGSRTTSAVSPRSEVVPPVKRISPVNREAKGEAKGSRKGSKFNSPESRHSSAGQEKIEIKLTSTNQNKPSCQTQPEPEQLKQQIKIEKDVNHLQNVERKTHTSFEQNREVKKQGSVLLEEHKPKIQQENTSQKQELLHNDEYLCTVKDQATSPMPVEFLQNNTHLSNSSSSSEARNKTPASQKMQAENACSITDIKTLVTAKETRNTTDASAASAKRTLPHHQTSQTNPSAEVDAILARKISSTDLSSAKERPFVANKVIHPPPKTSKNTSSVVPSSNSSSTSQKQKSPGTATIKAITESCEADNQPMWRDIGEVEVLRRTKCRRIYAKDSQEKDVALFYKSGTFFALEAWCSHMGKI